MIDDDGEKQRGVYTAVRLISVERGSVCVQKSVLAALCIFVRLDRSPMSHIFFPLVPLFLSREEKRTKRFETRANERVDLQKQNIRRLLSPFITIRGVLVVVRASEKKEHVGYVEESIQERILTSSRF